MKHMKLNWRILFIISVTALVFLAALKMHATDSGVVESGRADLSEANFKENKLVNLGGNWEFYWNRLLTSQDFIAEKPPQMDSLIKVPNTWDDRKAGTKVYPHHGVATYRLRLKYPASLKDPALRIQNVSTACKIYANGLLIAEIGKVSDKPSDFKEDKKSLILDLPKDTQEVELLIQVANLNYPRGGLRESPIFGSKQVLEEQEMMLLAIQLLFIGGVFIFAIYYLLLFLLQTENKVALIFSILCFITALRALILSESTLRIFLPNLTYGVRIYIDYFTGYNFVPIVFLFILNIYPLEYNKNIARLIWMPTLFLEVLLLAPTKFMSSVRNYLYILILLQILYIVGILIKAVLHKRENAMTMFISIYILILTIIQDMMYSKGSGGVNLSCMALYGNFTVIIAMSFVQAKFQSSTHKKLALYNEKLVEADILKDKIMATEMSFLQAQIKPHFLYNALNAIANVCEKDGEIASKLILDLAIYLRGSLEFNHLNKMANIEKELEFINTYFHIEQARFGEKVQLSRELEISLEYQIPVLILQPLVENAVRHGISKKQGGGVVIIRMKETTEGIEIEIEDNGVGIEAEKLALLLSEERKEKGVGLLNIHHRLLKLYGSGLEITSEMERGTKVKIVIPKGEK